METPYSIEFAVNIKHELSSLTPKQQQLIVKQIETLAINPRPTGTQKVPGMVGLYRTTINEHQLLYKVEEKKPVVLIIKLSNNHDQRQRLSELLKL